MAGDLVVSLGNDRFDAVLSQPRANARKGVALISGQAPWAPAHVAMGLRDSNGLDDAFKAGGLMLLSGCDFDDQRQPASVD